MTCRVRVYKKNHQLILNGFGKLTFLFSLVMPIRLIYPLWAGIELPSSRILSNHLLPFGDHPFNPYV